MSHNETERPVLVYIVTEVNVYHSRDTHPDPGSIDRHTPTFATSDGILYRHSGYFCMYRHDLRNGLVTEVGMFDRYGVAMEIYDLDLDYHGCVEYPNIMPQVECSNGCAEVEGAVGVLGLCRIHDELLDLRNDPDTWLRTHCPHMFERDDDPSPTK